jgi:hypothetical protein
VGTWETRGIATSGRFRARALLATACGLGFGCGLLAVAGAGLASEGWLDISQGSLCVTEGAVEKSGSARMTVNVPKIRAYVNEWAGPSAELRFTYLGGTAQESALGSGEVRRQLGLKLQAQDPCNLVYVMWRIEPESKLVVSVKRNRNEHSSAACGNRGYHNIKPAKSSAVPKLQAGEPHTLRAELRKEELTVFADDREVWRGELGADASGLKGPVGVRSDNAHFEFQLKARKYEGTHPNFALSCKTGAAFSD